MTTEEVLSIAAHVVFFIVLFAILKKISINRLGWLKDMTSIKSNALKTVFVTAVCIGLVVLCMLPLKDSDDFKLMMILSVVGMITLLISEIVVVFTSSDTSTSTHTFGFDF